MNFKYDRLSQDIKELVNNVINEKIDDLDFVTVTDVELTKDLADAKIFVNCMMDNSKDYVIDTLNKKKGLIRKEIASKIKMRRIPNLIFKYDSSLTNYNKIDELLKNS